MITYFELLQMIKEGRPPKRVLYGGFVWEWNINMYTRKRTSVDIRYLNVTVADDYSDVGLTKEKIIELLPDVPGGERSV